MPVPDRQPRTQPELVVNAIKKMDIVKLQKLLSEEYTYQSMPKERFLEKLKVVFDKFREMGDKKLDNYPGHCSEKYCHFKFKGMSFQGITSNKHLDLIIDIKKGHVIDIFECNSFEIPDFDKRKEGRIYLDDRLSFS
jgi:hypothetical protein